LAQDYATTVETLFDFGQTFLRQKRYVEAKHEFEKCLLLNPEHSQAKNLLELCKKKMLPEKEKAMSFALEEAERKIKPKVSTPAPQPKEKVVEKVMPEEKTKVSTEERFPFIGGAWGLPKGRWLLESYTKYYYHNSQFDSEGEKKRWADNGKGSEIDTELKIDYGAFDNLTLWVHIPYKEAYWKNDYGKHRTRGLADIWAGGKYRFLDKPLVLSLQLAGKFPAGYDENDSPSIGNGQIDQEIMLLSAKSFGSLFYLKADLGYRWRYEEPADTIPYFFEFGYHPLDRLLFKAALDGVESIKDTGRIEDYTKWVASMLFTLKKWINPLFNTEDKVDLELGYGETFTGKNASAASEVFAKILYYF
jgi:hypothetical protein